MKIIFSIILAAVFLYPSQCHAKLKNRPLLISEKKSTIFQAVISSTNIIASTRLTPKQFFDSITRTTINGHCLLYAAIYDIDALKYLLDIVSSRLTDQQLFFNFLTTRDINGVTPIQVAVCENSESLKYLLDIASSHLTDPQLFFNFLNQKDPTECNPLYMAASENSESFKYLLDAASAHLVDQQLFFNFLNQGNVHGATPIHMAAWKNSESLKYLLDIASARLTPKQFFNLLNQGNVAKFTPIHVAAGKNSKSLKYLLDTASTYFKDNQPLLFKLLTTTDIDGNTPLRVAAGYHNSESFKYLIAFMLKHDLIVSIHK